MGQDLFWPNLQQPYCNPHWPSGTDLAVLACDLDVFPESILDRGCGSILTRGRPVSVEIHRDRDALVNQKGLDKNLG